MPGRKTLKIEELRKNMKSSLYQNLGLQAYEKTVNSDLIQSVLFQVSILCIVLVIAAIILVVTKKEKYLMPATVLLLIAAFSTILFVERKVVFLNQAVEIGSAPAPAPARIMEFSGEGADRDEAVDDLMDKIISDLFAFTDGKNFSSLQDSTRKSITDKTATIIDVKVEINEDKSVKAATKVNMDELEKALAAMGYRKSPILVTLGITNNTDKPEGELMKRLKWSVENESDYFLGGAFHTTKENLDAELSSMNIQLGEGIRQSRFIRLEESPAGDTSKFRAIFEIN